jgi:DNA-binding CsgD family transcriptional regulator
MINSTPSSCGARLATGCQPNEDRLRERRANCQPRVEQCFDEIDSLLGALTSHEVGPILAERAAAQKALRAHVQATAALAAVLCTEVGASGGRATKTLLGRHKHTLHSLIEDFGATAAMVRRHVAPQFDSDDLFLRVAAGGDLRTLERLTAREREILNEVIKGHSNKIIAYRLNLRPTTVKAHVTNLLRKLGVHSRMRAAALFRPPG